MKYFSTDTVIRAYCNNAQCTSNKFWGVLGILASIREFIQPGKSYNFNPGLTAEFLQDLFCLGDKKDFSGMRARYYVVFSTLWISKIHEIMCHLTPNFYDVAVWMFRNRGFKHEPTISELKELFKQVTNLNDKQLGELFNFSTTIIKYSEKPTSDRELLNQLTNRLGNKNRYTSLSAEGSFIKANPGEFSRAPFIQTIYAAQRAPECLLLTQFDVLKSYGLISK